MLMTFVDRAHRNRCRRVAVGALLCCAAMTTSAVDAAPPKVTRLSVRGFQTGGVTRLVVQGTDLSTDQGVAPQLVCGAGLKGQKLIGTAKPTTVEFDVELDSAIVAGIYPLRIATSEGVSAAEFVTVDVLPQRAVVPAGDDVVDLPIALHGTLAGSAVQPIVFRGRKGQSITIDVLARRLGSKLRPVVHLYDADKRQLAWSLPQTALAGDARVSAVLPSDGDYTVAVHDLTYAAATPGHYRVAIGSFDYVDQVFPPVVERGTSTELELIGRFGEQTSLSITQAEMAAAFSSSAADGLGDVCPLPWPLAAAPIGLRPYVRLSDLRELTEDRTLGASRMLPATSVAVSGRLDRPDETDVYHLDLAADEQIRAEVFADRLGSPIDAVLEIRDDQGRRLALSDDVVGPDPRLDYTAAKNPTRVTLAVNDALRRGDQRSLYRLVVTRDVEAKPANDFRLSFVEDTHNLASDGTKVFRVSAERAGYEEAIRLTAADLPHGFSAAAVEIPAGADGALVEIRHTGDAKLPTFAPLAIHGETIGLKPAIRRTAESSASPLGRLQPWLNTEMIAAAAQSKSPVAVEWADKSAVESLYQGTDDKLAIRLRRDPTAKGSVRLALVTTQAAPPVGTTPQNAPQLLRGVAATMDVKPDAKKDTADFAIRIPADLRAADYDVAIRAEQLSDDGRSTVAEAFTPPLRIRVLPPIEIVADAGPQGPIALDARTGAVVVLTGTLERRKNYAGDVTITLVGLPAGIAAPSAVLKPKKDDYRLEFKLPPTFSAAKIEGVTISAMITPDNRRANTAGKTAVPVPTLEVRKVPVAVVK